MAAPVRAGDGGARADRGGVWRTAAGSAAVRAALSAAVHVVRIEVVDRVGSTQDAARVLAETGAAAGTLVIAERQESGRGRSGRGWDDDVRPGASLAATLVAEPPGTASLVPHAAGLGVLDALGAWPHVVAALKWPNDVVVRAGGMARKLAGILVERSEVDGRDLLLIGIGLNVDRRHVPDLVDRTAVADVAGTDVDLARLLAGLVAGLDAALRLLSTSTADLLARYRSRCDTVDREVLVTLPDGRSLRGRAEVDALGRLRLATERGPVVVIAGTVRDVVSSVPPTDVADAGADRA